MDKYIRYIEMITFNIERDKVLHSLIGRDIFVISLLLLMVLLGASTSITVGALVVISALLSLVVVSVVAVGRELYNKYYGNTGFSVKDLYATVIPCVPYVSATTILHFFSIVVGIPW